MQFSPTSEAIIGIKMQDGSIEEFECLYEKECGQAKFYYIYPIEIRPGMKLVDGQMVLVDAKGEEWTLSAVEYASTHL